MRDLVVFERNEAWAVGLWRHVFATIFVDPPSLEQLRALHGWQEEAAARCPGGFVALSVLPSRHVQMAPEVREAAEELSRNPSPALVAVAQVITGDGFVAATTRMIAQGMMLLRRTPTKLFGTVDDASEWVCGRLREIPDAPGATPAALVAAMQVLDPRVG